MIRFCAFFVVFFASAAYAQDKAAYELAERCRRTSAEVFAKDFPKDEVASRNMVASYENHYNRKLNKCFIIERSVTWSKDTASLGPLVIMYLLDVQENKTYGEFLGQMNCEVGVKKCSTEEGWKELARPYMEE